MLPIHPKSHIFNQEGYAMKAVKHCVMVMLFLCTALVVFGHATVYAKDMLYPGEELKKGDNLTSANGRYQLIFQRDGNLVLYGPRDRALWASNTQGRPVERCIMQTDGNLVLYLRGGQAIWNSQTYRFAGSFLWLQNDGNVVLYYPVWSTGTAQKQRDHDRGRWRP
jgi:hypothetical protein